MKQNTFRLAAITVLVLVLPIVVTACGQSDTEAVEHFNRGLDYAEKAYMS